MRIYQVLYGLGLGFFNELCQLLSQRPISQSPFLYKRNMLFKSIFTSALLATSAVAFNGQAPTSFAPKSSQSETVLKMAGGNVAPALKVR